MLEISRIKETGVGYRTPAEFFEAYAKKSILGLTKYFDHTCLIEHSKKAGSVTFATTSGGRWPYADDLHKEQEVFEVTIVGVQDESLDELAELAAAAALEWEHGVVLDGTLPRDFHLVGQLWSALMPLLEKDRPDHAKYLKSRVLEVEVTSVEFKERSDKVPSEPRAPYMQIEMGDYLISFNRYASEGQILEAIRSVEAHIQGAA